MKYLRWYGWRRWLFAVLLLMIMLTYLVSPGELMVVGSESQYSSHVSAENSDVTGTATDIDEFNGWFSSLKTFRGATVDGALQVDADGELVINLALRQWLDFHLSAQGEVPLSQILTLMQKKIQQLPMPGREQAALLLMQYVGYLDALKYYDAEQQKRITLAQSDDIFARMRWQQRLRKEWLSAEVVNAFFAADEAMDNHTIAKLQAYQSEADQETLQSLDQQLPEALQQMKRQTRSVVELNQTEQQLTEKGASSEEVHLWRQQRFGQEAATRLAMVDKRQAAWQQKVKRYQRYQRELEAGTAESGGLDTETLHVLLRDYRNQHFTANERKRLNAAMMMLSDKP